MMSSFEMTPFAPGRLSTMTWRPRPVPIFGAIWRATRSVAPPGGKPTIMRTGLLGAQSEALHAGAADKRKVAAAPVRQSVRIDVTTAECRILEPSKIVELKPLRRIFRSFIWLRGLEARAGSCNYLALRIDRGRGPILTPASRPKP